MRQSLRDQIRHVRPVVPVLFPATDPEWDLGQNKLHGRLCDLLYRVLTAVVGPNHTVSDDQFLYYDASDPRRRCAPDHFVKLGVPDENFASWKTWEGGVPELCVEILSPSDMEKLTLDEKLSRYLAIGVAEVLVYDPSLARGERLRAWDRVDEDLVERVVEDETTPCLTLGGLHWVLVRDDAIDGDALRLAEDARGEKLALTREEGWAAEQRARAESAEAEVARLREELSRARGGA